MQSISLDFYTCMSAGQRVPPQSVGVNPICLPIVASMYFRKGIPLDLSGDGVSVHLIARSKYSLEKAIQVSRIGTGREGRCSYTTKDGDFVDKGTWV